MAICVFFLICLLIPSSLIKDVTALHAHQRSTDGDDETETFFVETDVLNVTFFSNGSVSSLYYDGLNMVTSKNYTFRLDWHEGKDEIPFKPTEFSIANQSSDTIHFYWTQQSNLVDFHIELHYVIRDGLDGVYTWAKYVNDQKEVLSLGTTRVVYRFNEEVFTSGTNSVRNRTLPLYEYLWNETITIQDETWLLPDGSYYTKYDLAGYIREIFYQGVYGNGYGAFLISASREYHNGGPLKQELLVHQDAIILNVFHGPHFGTYGLDAPSGWSHIYGPYLIYFNKGSDEDVVRDAAARADVERDLWPYQFVNDEADYPVERGSVYGKVVGPKSAAVAVYDSVSEEFDDQALGYMYTTETDEDGVFVINNIRPGNYKVVTYSLSGDALANVSTNVIIAPREATDAGTLTLPVIKNVLWRLGEVNRRSSEFKYADQLRNYIWFTLPPADLVFTIGEDDPKEDWYYAQTKAGGTWTIRYNDEPDGHRRTLRVSLAAASRNGNVTVSINGHELYSTYYANDQSIYRSALQSGHYYSFWVIIPDTYVVSGSNLLTFKLNRGLVMYDAISLQFGIPNN